MNNNTTTAIPGTKQVITQFNEAFRLHDATILNDIIADDCLMETAMPAPNGIITKGKDECLAFWQELIAAPGTQFKPEDVSILGERAIIIWRYSWGAGEENSVKGVSLMTVKNGLITEALAYTKGTLGN